MKRYFAKKDTFFKEGSEAFREDEMFAYGTLFNLKVNSNDFAES